jgi:hypothetical protein
MYVLPTSTTDFIGIYIVFTSTTKREYEQEIKQYIENLGIQNFK